MVSDFYIPMLYNDMKIAVQKIHLVGQIWYRSLDPVKKNGVILFYKNGNNKFLSSNMCINFDPILYLFCQVFVNGSFNHLNGDEIKLPIY